MRGILYVWNLTGCRHRNYSCLTMRLMFHFLCLSGVANVKLYVHCIYTEFLHINIIEYAVSQMPQYMLLSIYVHYITQPTAN